MKILVTGGAGFIGSHTVDALLRKGHDVRIVDNLAKPVHLKGKPGYIPDEAEFILGDVRDRSVMINALEEIDAVYHFAAYQDYLPDFSTYFHVNSVSTALIYELIVEKKLPVKKVIVASSQAVLGEGLYRCDKHGEFIPDIRIEEQMSKGDWNHHCPVCSNVMYWLPTPEDKINPNNQYALSKYSQEQIAFNLGRRYDIPSVALRYSIVQGPRQSFYNAYSGANRIFCLSLFMDRPPTIYEDGRQIRDFINIEDVVDANLLVLESDKADYQMFNVGGEKPYTILEFYEIVKTVFGKDIKPRLTGEYRYGDTRNIVSDISKLKTLGWVPRHTPEKSVRDYKAYLERQTHIDDILTYAEKHMKDLGVVRQSKKIIQLL
jgi:dTDP-L-rhamnose 4-epimerase